MTVRVYSNSDAGAPVLTGQVGSLEALLHACLVTGYSTGETYKAPAGWTRPYADTNKAVFRINTELGSGRYLYVDDNRGEPRSALVNMYEGATSISDLSQGYSTRYFFKSTVADATPRAWIVVADECAVYFTNQGQASSVPGFYFAGDVTQTLGSGLYTALIATSSTTATSASSQYDNVDNSINAQSLDLTGSTAYRGVGNPGIDGSFVGAQYVALISHFAGINPSSPQAVVQRADENAANGTTLRLYPVDILGTNVVTSSTPRRNFRMGLMPGLAISSVRNNGAIAHGAIISVEGSDYIGLNCRITGELLYIKLSGWRT